MRIIVVGNAPCRSNRGHLINLFDFVVRLSCCKIKGYEHLVGSKTDAISIARIENLDPLPPKVWVGNPLGLSAVPKEIVEDTYPNGIIANSVHGMYELYDMDCFDLHNGPHPTLGLKTIMMALEFGKFFYDLPITITGIEGWHEGQPTYYFDDTPAEKIGSHLHNYSAERRIIKDLIAKKKVKLLEPTDMRYLEDYPWGPPRKE